MEKIKDIQEQSSLLEDKIEKKLFCIKAYNYKFDEEFKKVFQFEFEASDQDISENNDVYIVLDGEDYVIENESRIITFIIDNKSSKRFIYNCKYLFKVINELNIRYYSTVNNKLNNSLESEFSKSDIFELFENENIKTIYKLGVDEKKLNELFKDRKKIKRKTISDLSLNASFYFPKNSNDIFESNIFIENSKKLKKFFFVDNKNILYLLGPKGSSKSLFLINFCYFCNFQKNPTLYINYKKLKNLDEKMRKYYFKKEMIYLFFDFNRFKDFYEAKHHRIIKGDSKDFFHNLKEFIQMLLNIYENTFNNKIIITIDNFDEDEENVLTEMEQLIKLVNDNSKKINVIFSGESIFLKKKFELFLKERNFEATIEKQILFLYYFKLENKNEIKTLAAFNYRKNINDKELENILLNEELEYCKKFDLYGLHFSIINNGKNLELEKLLKYIYIIPFEYLKFSINQDKSIKFEYFNPIFFKAAQKSIQSEVKEKSLEFLLKNDNKDFLINGIYEEKLLNLIISYNKLNLENMKTIENNLLEVDKIYNFKYKINKKTDKKIDNHLPIIIGQKIFTGELYDLLVLIPINDKEGNILYSAYMIQIGTNKTGTQIREIKNDFDDNKKKYLTGITTFVDNGIKIENIELIFIFDTETQKNLQLKKAYPSVFGSRYCLMNGIKFYCFSYDTYKLCKTFDNRNYFKINKFGDFDRYNTKKNWSNYNLERFEFLVQEEIDFINSKLMNETIEKYQIYVLNQIKFEEVIDNEKIYVLISNSNKYFIIHGQIYSHVIDKFEIIDNNKVIGSEELFDIFILTRFRHETTLKKKSNH